MFIYFLKRCHIRHVNNNVCVYVLLVQDSEMEGSDVDLSIEDEEEWRSDSSRYSCCHQNCF